MNELTNTTGHQHAGHIGTGRPAPGAGAGTPDRYRALVEATSQVVWSVPVGDDGRRVGEGMEASKRWWSAVTGQSIDEQNARPDAWLDAVHHDDRDAVAGAWSRAMREETTYEAEFRVRDTRGGWRRIEARGVPIRDAHGVVYEWFGTLNDVTAEREAEDALQLSEARYRALVNATSEMVYRMSADWSEMQPLDWQGLVPTNRQPSRDWLTKDLPAFEHGRVLDRVRHAIETRSAFEMDHQVIRRDGSLGWTHSRATPILKANGEIIEWFGTATDITDRKRVDNELRDIRSRMEAALSVGAIGTWSWDIVADRFYADASLARIFSLGVTGPAEIPLSSALAAIHPDDRPRVDDLIARALAGADYYETEYRVTTPDGTCRWINARGQVERDAEGRPLRFPGVVIDITGHKQDQQELARVRAESDQRKRLYETILSNTPDLAHVFDLQHRFIYANEVMLRVWGKTWDEAIGRTCLELGYEPWHAAMHDREIDEVVANRRPIRGEVPFEGAFGRRIYEYIFVPVLGAEGQVEAVAGTTRDVTERKAMEQSLRDADRRKDDFIALLAHELRNPLAPIRHGIQLLRVAQDDPEAVSTACSVMERQIAHMVRLIDDLLDVSRVTRNKLDLQRRSVALSEIIDHAVETVGPLVREFGHDLTVDLPDTPVVIDADSVRLAQVFSNLLINSVRYTPASGRIRVHARTEADAVAVTVEDNGVGIPADSIDRIFDMFSQIAPRPGRPGVGHAGQQQGGLGMGLALVKGLVEMHGGTVGVDSAEGRGSAFTVRLPTVRTGPAHGPGSRHAPAAASRAARREVLKRRTGRRVLIVDDNRDSAESLAALLRALGDEVALAHDGPGAVAAAEAYDPAVIIIDIGLPGMSGLDATRRIRAFPHGRRPTIIALTGWGQELDRQRSREAGCDAHLVKPVNFADLAPLLPEPDATDA